MTILLRVTSILILFLAFLVKVILVDKSGFSRMSKKELGESPEGVVCLYKRKFSTLPWRRDLGRTGNKPLYSTLSSGYFIIAI